MDWTSVILGAFMGVAGVFGAVSLALYPPMGRSFLLWNFGRTAGFVAIAVSSLPAALAPPLTWGLTQNTLGDIGVALSAACTANFLASYLEARMALGRLRRRLRWLSLLGVIAAISTALAAHWPVLTRLHDALLLALIVAVSAALAVAIRHGSRAARYQALAWAPLIAVGLGVLSYELATGREAWLWPLAVVLAVMFDFVVTARGLVEGFMVIKRERDIAWADVREAKRASTLDPLTGVANRRGLAQRFAAGRPMGVAVIDCDRFKRINDNFGHDVGDAVLVAVAKALEGEHIYVGRLGGEEFLALIYHKDWEALAEAARQRVTAAVERRVPELASGVTASAGLARVHDDDTIESAMKRADRALYAAKDAGRDRSLRLPEAVPGAARLAQVG